MIDRNTKTKLLCVAVASLFAVSAGAQSEDALGAGLKKCAAVTDDVARLSCFDALVLVTGSAPAAAPAAVADAPPAAPDIAPAPAPSPTPAPAVESAAATVATAEAVTAVAESAPSAEPAAAPVPVVEPDMQPINDEIGKAAISDEQPVPTKYSARVTRCQENRQSGQYYFFFENGQVWKQSKYRRLHWNECEFDVEVSKGMFGYDMYIPEKDRSIRITRIR